MTNTIQRINVACHKAVQASNTAVVTAWDERSSCVWHQTGQMLEDAGVSTAVMDVVGVVGRTATFDATATALPKFLATSN